jgi:hypothetical protein
MRFEPKSEEELKSVVLAPGVYDGEVLKAEEKTSKKGNDMIVLTLKFYGAGDDATVVNDYLLDSMPKKLRHFCEAAGILDLYESGEFQADDCQGRSVKARLKVDRDPSGQYEDKNAVADYVVDKPVSPPQPAIPKMPVNYKSPDPNAAFQQAAASNDPDVPF